MNGFYTVIVVVVFEVYVLLSIWWLVGKTYIDLAIYAFNKDI